jgi:hypothetical protein
MEAGGGMEIRTLVCSRPRLRLRRMPGRSVHESVLPVLGGGSVAPAEHEANQGALASSTLRAAGPELAHPFLVRTK